MSVVGVIVVFMVTWWLVFFMVLPVGVRMEETLEAGHASSAPRNPRIKAKMLLTTAVAVVLTGLFFFLMTQGYLDFIEIRGR